MKSYHATLTLIEPMLGTVPKNKDLYSDYIAGLEALKKKKAPEDIDTADELETLPEDIVEKSYTGFHEVEGKPIIYNYLVKGFFKDACSMLRRVTGTRSSKITSFKKIIDGLVFVKPRRIPINLNGFEIDILERPLRAQTPKGERICLAKSDTVPAESILEFDIEVLGVVKKADLVEWLDYGSARGLGQWRNAGYGSFTYKLS